MLIRDKPLAITKGLIPIKYMGLENGVNIND